MSSGQRSSARIREIASAANPLLKVFRRALADGVTREGLLALEGPLLVEEALQRFPGIRPVQVQSVLVSRTAADKFAGVLERIPAEAEVAQIPDRLFDSIAQTEAPQGIAALVEMPAQDLDGALRRPDALVVVACGLQDPGNLGAILRSAQALGATALVTLPGTVSPFNPKTVRSSAGAIFRLPVFPRQEAASLLDRLKSERVQIVAADRYGSHSLASADLRGPAAFLVGQEASGLPEEVAESADLRLSIPIRPGTDSLNAAVAAGIFLYEAARQRGFHY